MILKRLAIDRFGIWRDWEVNEIPRGLTVFFGPNETGKSTLLEFLRGMFFGFAPRSHFADAEQREMGGTLVVEHLGKEVTIFRRWASDRQEEVKLTVGDQDVSPEELTRSLCPVDEATFNAVFALGLEDLAYLRTLEEGKTAELLYELSLGADRAVLWQALTDFQRHFAEVQNKKEIVELEKERARLLNSVEEAGHQTRQHVRWRATRERLRSEIQLLEKRLRLLEQEKESCEAILNLEPKWQEYREIIGRLRDLGKLQRVSKAALRRIDRLRVKIAAAREDLSKWRDALRKQEEAVANLPVNAMTLEHAAEIEAIRLHRDEIAVCREQLCDLERRHSELLQARSTIWNELTTSEHGRDADSSKQDLPLDAVPKFDQRGTPKVWSELRRWVKRWQKIMAEKQRIAEEHRRRLIEQDELHKQIQLGLEKYGAKDPQVALEERSQRATALRRIRQLTEQESALKRRIEDVATEYRQQLARLLPSWQTWATTGSLSIPGLTLVLLSLIALLGGPGSGTLGLITLVIGAAMMAGGIGAKAFSEHRHHASVEVLRQDLDVLRRELETISLEQQKLSQEVKVSPSEVDRLLSHLEQEIRELEPIAVLQTKLAEISQRVEVSRKMLQRMEDKEHRVAFKVREMSETLQMPVVQDAQHAAQLWLAARRLRNVDRRLASVTKKMREWQDRLAAWQERVFRLARICGQATGSEDVLQVLDELVRDYETSVENRRRHLDVNRTKRLRHRRIRHIRGRIKRLTTRYRAMLRELGARTSEDLVTIRQNWEHAQDLRRQAKEIRRELKAALVSTGIGDQTGVAATLQEAKAKHRACVEEIETTTDRLRNLEDKCREAETEIQRLLQAREIDQAKLALVALEEHLQRHARRRQTFLLLAHFLERVRHHYEMENQPETLQRASVFLSQMTETRYRRVWTPIKEQTLLVEDASGRSWRIEELSRGTREQLFLSLRLAIVQRSTKQGICLPLVLDDVLVNFDTQRAQAACRTLHTFAEETSQVLLLTCHDHIAQLCSEMSVPVANLEMASGKRRTAPSFFSASCRVREKPAEQQRFASSEEDNHRGMDHGEVGPPAVEEGSSVPTQPRRQRQKKQTSGVKPKRTPAAPSPAEDPAPQGAGPNRNIALTDTHTWYAEADPYGDDLAEELQDASSLENPATSHPLSVNRMTDRPHNRAA